MGSVATMVEREAEKRKPEKEAPPPPLKHCLRNPNPSLPFHFNFHKSSKFHDFVASIPPLLQSIPDFCTFLPPKVVFCFCKYEDSALLTWLVVLLYVPGNTTAVGGVLLPLRGEPLPGAAPVADDRRHDAAAARERRQRRLRQRHLLTRSGDADVGLNSVLGGAFFISCFVVGVVSIAISERRIRVDKASFVRDVLFFLFVLCCVIAMNVFGTINFWFALCFLCIYFLYIALVCTMHTGCL